VEKTNKQKTMVTNERKKKADIQRIKRKIFVFYPLDVRIGMVNSFLKTSSSKINADVYGCKPFSEHTGMMNKA